MTRIAGPDCAVMCNSINTHTHTIDSEYVDPEDVNCITHILYNGNEAGRETARYSTVQRSGLK